MEIALWGLYIRCVNFLRGFSCGHIKSAFDEAILEIVLGQKFMVFTMEANAF